jgi:DNA-binding ferritin-like protein
VKPCLVSEISTLFKSSCPVKLALLKLQGFIKELLIDHEHIVIHMRGSINRLSSHPLDTGSSDFIAGVMKQHEKMAWMLRAHLKS